MRMLTRHGHEIAEEYMAVSWEEYRDLVTCIDVTPVNKFFHKNQETFLDTREDFGSVRPPWERTWAEYVVQSDTGIDRIGVTISYAGADDVSYFQEHMDTETFESLFCYDSESTNMVVSTGIFVDLGRNSWKCEGGCLVFMDEDGRMREAPDKRFYPMPRDEFVDVCESSYQARTVLVMRLMPILLGFGFCHCPNVTIWEDEKAEAIRENRKSKGQNPGQVFKCLEIEPLQEEIRRKSQDSDGSAERRRHEVRGHFKHYSEEAPLFGHYTGNVWCPPHERGSEQEGRVDKEYRSKAPGED